MTASQKSKGASAKAVVAKQFSAYALEKCLIGFGLINGVINAIVFYCMYMGQPDATFDYSHVVADIAMTSIFIGVILFACAVPLTKGDVRKGHVELPPTDGVASFVPKRYVLALISVGVLTCIVTTGVTALVAMVLPMPLGVISMMIFKGVLCAVAGGVSGLLAIAYTLRAVRPATAA